MHEVPWSSRVRRQLRLRQSWVLCHLGRHLWVRRSNPDLGGPKAVYHLCRRCGVERNVFEPRSYERPPRRSG